MVIDVVRSADLVALTFAGYDLELVGGSQPHLRPIRDRGDEKDGTLVVASPTNTSVSGPCTKV